MATYSRVRDLREDADKTQADIAKMLNMQTTVYQRYERGERELPLWAAIKLADYYKVSLDYLVGREDDFGNVVVSAPNSNLSPTDEKLLKDFSTLGPHEQDFIRGQIQFLLNREVIKK